MRKPASTVEARLALEEQVEAVIESLRPMIMRHNGNVELVGVTEKLIAELKFLGACADCTIADITLNDGLKTSIMLEVPQITDVVIV